MSEARASFGIPKRLDLFAYRRLITREISGELRQLRGEKTPHRKNEHEGKYSHAHDRQPARHMDMLQNYDHRRQHEAEEYRQRNGHEDLTTKIEHRDNDDSEDCSRHRAEQCHNLFSRTHFERSPDHMSPNNFAHIQSNKTRAVLP